VLVNVNVDGAQGGSIFRDDASVDIDDSIPIEPTSFDRIEVRFREQPPDPGSRELAARIHPNPRTHLLTLPSMILR
jgi:hypothetical protein